MCTYVHTYVHSVLDTIFSLLLIKKDLLGNRGGIPINAGVVHSIGNEKHALRRKTFSVLWIITYRFLNFLPYKITSLWYYVSQYNM